MSWKVCVILALLIALPVWSQVEPSASGGPAPQDEDTRMITPPAVSGATLPLVTELGQRSNYLSGGVTFTPAYILNVQPGEASPPINDQSYSIWPILTIDRTTPRAAQSLTYSSGFTFYQRATVLNSVNQNLDASVDLAASRHLTISLQDLFRQNSNLFNQPLSASGGQTPPPVQNTNLIIPYSEELENRASTIFSYQFAEFSMVGGMITFDTLNFPNLGNGSGLYNSQAESALGFYSRRLSRAQYLGGMYEFDNVQTTQKPTTTQTQTASIFYALYLAGSFTLSVAAGPQHLDFAQPGSQTYRQWTPSVRTGLGWQAARIRLAAGYSRDLTAGQGLLGVYTSDSADASIHWQLTRSWTINSFAVYDNYKSNLPALLRGSPGGHTISGTASADYAIGEHLVAGFGYTRLYQNYSEIAALSPNSDRSFFSISWQFRRPLGR